MRADQPKSYALELVEKYGMPGSDRLVRILEMILSADEMRLVAALPFDIHKPIGVESILPDLDLGLKAAKEMLADLYQRGIVAIGNYEGAKPQWYVPGLGLLLDSTNWDPRFKQYGQAFYDLWRDFVNEEMLPLMKTEEGYGFHVIPVNETIPIEGTRQVVRLESAQDLVKKADRIVVLQCPCRTHERKCDAPLETCISLNTLAEYFLSREIGREIDSREALAILANCEEHGLVHEIPTSDNPDMICNCCTCCCLILTAMQVTQSSPSLVGSGYHPVLDEEKCIQCLDCVEVCPFDAMLAEEGKPLFQPERCLGCGLCVQACPASALQLVEVEMPERKIRQNPLGGGVLYSHIHRKDSASE